MNKIQNNKAWFFVLPVFALVAFNALIPLMTVVNYSIQETFGNNEFFWAGPTWFSDILRSDRFHAALGRSNNRRKQIAVGNRCSGKHTKSRVRPPIRI